MGNLRHLGRRSEAEHQPIPGETDVVNELFGHVAEPSAAAEPEHFEAIDEPELPLSSPSNDYSGTERGATETTRDNGPTEPPLGAQGAASPVKPSKKAILAVSGVMLLMLIVLLRGCFGGSEKPKEETVKLPAAMEQWRPTEPDAPKPLADINPSMATSLGSGVERERGLKTKVENLTAVEPPKTPAVEAVDTTKTKSAPESAKVQELEQKVQELTKALDASKKESENLRKKIVKRAGNDAKDGGIRKAPSVKVMAIARTERCQSCPLLALVEMDGAVSQVATGDTVKGYTVGVERDRVTLTKMKQTLTFYSFVAP